MGSINRRQFVAVVPGIGLASAFSSLVKAADGETANALWPEFPHQKPEWVREMVGVCHRDVDRARALLNEHPALVNATWDWGFVGEFLALILRRERLAFAVTFGAMAFSTFAFDTLDSAHGPDRAQVPGMREDGRGENRHFLGHGQSQAAHHQHGVRKSASSRHQA